MNTTIFSNVLAYTKYEIFLIKIAYRTKFPKCWRDPLLRENEIILQGDEGLDGSTELEALEKQCEEIEIQISHKEARLQLLEEDNGYRKEAVKVLERLQNTSEPMIELKEQRREMTFLRAFAVVIEALSPFTFTITWLSGKTTTIELEEGE